MAEGVKKERGLFEGVLLASDYDGTLVPDTRIVTPGVKAALRANHVETLNARGVITGRNSEGYTVEAGGSTYTGARLLICTGSSPAIPPIPGLKEGLESGFAVTNRELLGLTEAPRRLVVIGGGVIGLEMAAYFNSIGSEITVIEMLDHIAGENDRPFWAKKAA